MKTLDRIIFGAIALALMLLTFQPYLARADHFQAVNIAAVAGKRLSFGETLPTK